MFRDGMKILCQNQEEFDKISKLAEKEGKKWLRPNVPRMITKEAIIHIDGNIMTYADEGSSIYNLKDAIKASMILRYPNANGFKQSLWYDYGIKNGMRMTLKITPQMVNDYRECNAKTEVVGEFPCNKCSWIKLKVGDKYMCEYKETQQAIKEAEKVFMMN